jgi:hypothetical protein
MPATARIGLLETRQVPCAARCCLIRRRSLAQSISCAPLSKLPTLPRRSCQVHCLLSLHQRPQLTGSGDGRLERRTGYSGTRIYYPEHLQKTRGWLVPPNAGGAMASLVEGRAFLFMWCITAARGSHRETHLRPATGRLFGPGDGCLGWR